MAIQLTVSMLTKLKKLDLLKMTLKVVSLFSGGGGLDLGFRNAGYNIIWAIDFNKDAVATYRKNLGDHIVLGDINSVDPYSLPKCDVIIGGPPCQDFSLAGKRKTDGTRGQLVWSYLKILSVVSPKAFLFENVSGLLSAKNKDGKKIFDLLLQSFQEIGYTISWKLVNAADYGIPQLRKRVIIVGTKNGVFDFPPITHNCDGSDGLQKYTSVQEAIGDLPNVLSNHSITEHDMPVMSELDKYIVSHVKPGGNYMDIPDEVNSKRIKRLKREGGHTTCYGRMLPDKPAYTINTYFNRPNVGCNIHYSEDRLITTREALRLQTFPDDFYLVSSSKQGKNLIIGNAVPPRLGYVLAEQLKNNLI